MKGLFLALISFILLIGSKNKKDIALPKYDTNVIYGISEVSVLGWGRSYSEKKTWHVTPDPTYLLRTTDSFYIKTDEYRENPIVFYSDSTFDYHLISFSSVPYYPDSVAHHAQFSFETQPSWFDINGFSEVFFYNEKPNKIYTPERTLVMDGTPSIYRLVVRENQIMALSSWDYKPEGEKLVSIRPFRYSRTFEDSNIEEYTYSRIFLTSEIDSLGDTANIFHRRTSEGYEMLRLELNHPDELIAAEGPTFLIQPRGDLIIPGHLDTTYINSVDSAAEFYLFSEMDFTWKDSSNLKTKVTASLGTEANADISKKGMILTVTGDSTLVNGNYITHEPNDLLPIGFNIGSIKTPRRLTNTIDLSSTSDYYEELMYINDTIKALTLVDFNGNTREIVFDDGITKQSRYLSTYSRRYNELFDYLNCEILSLHKLNSNKTSPHHFLLSSNLYGIKNFNDSSSIDINGSHSSIDRIRKEGNYYPQYVLTGMFLYGSVSDVAKSSVTLFPNPSEGQVKIKSKNEIIGNYSVLDLNGKSVQNGRLNNNEFSINREVPNGTYFIGISTSNRRYTGKLILIR